jgi:uncharacterized membrane protein YhaH (DUF805 family)
LTGCVVRRKLLRILVVYSWNGPMDWVNLFTSFEGRITRLPFWMAWAVFVAIEIGISFSGGDDARWGSALDLVLTYPQFAVCAKRGHDRNTPMWVVGLFFATGVVLDVLLLGGWITNADVANATPLMLAFLIPYAVFGLALLVDLGFRRGTVGPNRYGPDPLETSA